MDVQKKIDTEALVGTKLQEDTFIDLCNVAKTLSDYAAEGDYALNEIVAIN
jgi:hypothetical protein